MTSEAYIIVSILHKKSTLSFYFQGQGDCKARTLPGYGHHFDLAFETFDDCPADSKSQSCALLEGISFVKTIENMSEHFF